MTDAPIVWKMSRDGYQAWRGVHRPWIAEISPFQYAAMSKRGKDEYDKKRRAEWATSADCARDYAEACFAAYENDLSILTHPDIHPDAKTAIFFQVRQKQETLEREHLDRARKENAITSPADVEIGDRIYYIVHSRYVTILKKMRASLRVRDDIGSEYTIKAAMCEWWHYNELKERVKNNQPVRPR